MTKRPKDWVRLACTLCHREDLDGITEARLAALSDWDDIHAAQSYEDATADNGDSAWWTHLGTCPRCNLRMAERLSDEQ